MAFKQKISFAIVACLPAAAIILACWEYGLGVSADSVNYLAIAENLSEWNGIVNDHNTVVTRWPPLYPLTIASIMLVIKVSALEAALVLNIILSFLTTLIILSILKKIKLGQVESIMIAVLFFISVPFTVFLWAWSEPLFFFFISLILWCSLQYDASGKTKYLLLIGIFSGLTILTRYAGLGLVMGIVLQQFFAKVNWNQKVKRLVILGATLTLALAPWVIFLVMNASDSTVREFNIHIITLEKITQLSETLRSWMVPYSRKGVIAAAILFVAMLYFIFSKQLKFQQTGLRKSFQRLLLLTLCSYVTFLVLSISFFDFHTPLDNRILGVVYLLMLLYFALMLPKQFFPLKHWKVTATLAWTILLILGTSWHGWVNHANYGDGFTHKIWLKSETMAATLSSKSQVIYSNGYDIINFHSKKNMPIKTIPVKVQPVSATPNSRFEKDLDRLKRCIEKGTCSVNYFDEVRWRWYLIEKDTLLHLFADEKIEYFNDGFIISSANNTN